MSRASFADIVVLMLAQLLSDGGPFHQLEPNDGYCAVSDSAIAALLMPYRPFGVNLGLERIHRLLEALDNPQNQVPTIHVAGTNGKGSVCAYLSSVLTAAGYRTGCSTSPHLVSWCERIRLNQQNIRSRDFEKLLKQVIAAIDPAHPQPTLFEITTAAAWLYFAEQKVDVAVVEVGLGGRLDGTNVKDEVLAAIVTSISKEHWQVLGDTLAKIAGEKAGILKAGCPAIVGPLPEEARAVVAARARELACPTTWVEPAIWTTPLLERGAAHSRLEEASEVGLSPDSGQEILDAPKTSNATVPLSKGGLGGVALASGITYPLSLMGDIQLTNSAIAIATLQSLRSQGWNISDEAIAQGMAATRWPGRMEWRSWRGHRLLIDGAHNPAAAVVLRDYVNDVWPTDSAQPVTWVMGMLNTKEHEAVLGALLKPGDRLYTVPVPDHSTEPPQQLAALGQAVCPGLADAQTYVDVTAALEAAFADSAAIVLCGSLYLLGHTLPQLEVLA